MLAYTVKPGLTVGFAVAWVDDLAGDGEILVVVDLNSPVAYGQLGTVKPIGFITFEPDFQTVTRGRNFAVVASDLIQ